MNRKVSAGTGAGFIGVGVAFLALGASGQAAFTGSGIIFLALGIGALVRSRSRDGSR